MSFPHVGCCVSEPGLVSLLEQGKEPWLVKRELMGVLFSGERGRPGVEMTAGQGIAFPETKCLLMSRRKLCQVL